MTTPTTCARESCCSTPGNVNWSGCLQLLGLVFSTTIIVCLLCCGDVETNPGPGCEFHIIGRGGGEGGGGAFN